MKRFKVLVICISILLSGMVVIHSDNVHAVDINDLWVNYADTGWYDKDPTAKTYEISTAKEFAGLSKIMIANGQSGTSPNFSGKTIRLVNNIDLSGHIWVPIGGLYLESNPDLQNKANIPYKPNGNPFKGTFDGENHTISHVQAIYDSKDKTDNLIGYGLFSYVEKATIKNFTLENSLLDYKNQKSNVTMLGIGFIVGDIISGDIQNISMKSNTFSFHGEGFPVLGIGGIVGHEYNSYSSSKVLNYGTRISNCNIDKLNMNIIFKQRATINCVGGVAGTFAFYQDIDKTHDSFIKNTNVTNTNISVGSQEKLSEGIYAIGGLAGLIYRKANLIDNSVEVNTDLSQVKFEKNSSASLVYGGAVGYGVHKSSYGNSQIISNIVKGNLKGLDAIPETKGGIEIGGVIGQNGESKGNIIGIENCYSEMDFSNVYVNKNTVLGHIIGAAKIKSGESKRLTKNIINNILPKDNQTKKFIANLNYEGTLEKEISYNWIVQPQIMRVDKQGKPLLFEQVDEKTVITNIYEHMDIDYEADMMTHDGNELVTFSQATTSAELKVKLTDKDATANIYEFKKNILVLANNDIGDIGGTITGEDTAGARVCIYYGSLLVAETIANDVGKYEFKDLPYNIYSLEVSKDNRLITQSIKINQNQMSQDVLLPQGILNTVVKNIDTHIAVDGLNDNFTDQDKTIANQPNNEVRLELISSQVTHENSEAKDIIENIDNSQLSWDSFIDMKIYKKTIVDSIVYESLPMSKLGQRLTIYIPMSDEMKANKNQVVIYRRHTDSKGDSYIEELSNNPNSLEYYQVDSDHILLHVHQFSLYAIALNQSSKTVTFQTNTVDQLSKQTALYGKLLKEPQSLIKSGYTFIGWYKDNTFQERWDFDKDIVYDDLTLYAKWENKKYQVTYDLDNGQTLSQKTVYYNDNDLLPNDFPVKKGFVFKGWYFDDKRISPLTAYSALAGDDSISTICIYAKWEKEVIEITTFPNQNTPSHENTEIPLHQEMVTTADNQEIGGYFIFLGCLILFIFLLKKKRRN